MSAMVSVSRSTSTSTLLLVFAGLALTVLAFVPVSNGEIHRAKAISSKYHSSGRAAVIKNRLLQAQQQKANTSWNWNVTAWFDWFTTVSDEDRCQIWIYSLISAALVGLSGIFPLLIIPLEVGEALKKGGPANDKLKLLLSFAVGGLLGDVFLHLLPEAWAHLDKLGGVHDGSINIGCWLLFGLLLFMLIEKAFPESDEEHENEEKIERDKKFDYTRDRSSGNSEMNVSGKNGLTIGVKKTHGGSVVNGIFQMSCMKNEIVNRVNSAEMSKDVNVGSGGLKNKTSREKGVAANNRTNGPACSQRGSKVNVKRNVERRNCDVDIAHHSSTHIKTSGWLNLLANVIDNFTHGLAVAGSYSVSLKTGLITTFAILLHEVPHEIGDFAILLRAGFDRWRAAKAQLFTATGGLLGAVFALMADSAQSAGDRTAWILPFTAGGFIYISMVTVLPELLHDKNLDAKQSLKQFILVCTGITVMGAITVLVD